jgi:hypothetical protein
MKSIVAITDTSDGTLLVSTVRYGGSINIEDAVLEIVEKEGGSWSDTNWQVIKKIKVK